MLDAHGAWPRPHMRTGKRTDTHAHARAFHVFVLYRYAAEPLAVLLALPQRPLLLLALPQRPLLLLALPRKPLALPRKPLPRRRPL